MKRLWMLVAALAIGLFAAGCGGDDEKQGFSSGISGSSSTASLTKAEFLAQGNAICGEANDKINAGADAFGGGPPDEQQAATFITDTLEPSINGAISQLKALGAPEGDTEILDSIYADTQALLKQLEADPNALISSDADPFAEVNQRFTDYGLTVCGGDDSGDSGTASTPTATTATVPDDSGSSAAPPSGGSSDSNNDGISDPY